MNNILVVDNQPENLKIIADFFIDSKHAYKIAKAPNGEVALDLINKNCPDLIIANWDMPGMDGIELIKQIKAIKCADEIPVIMCTGVMTSSEKLQIALESGAFDYIRKPIDKVELEARVNSALRYNQSQIQHKQTENRLKETQSIAHMGTWEFGFATGEIIWSDETWRIWGREPKPEGPCIEEYFESIHPHDRELLNASIAKAEQGKSYEIELRHKIPDGTYNYVIAKCKPIKKNGKVVKLLGTILDITDRKNMENDLRASKEKYRLLVDSTEDVIFTLNMNLQYTYISPSIKLLRGYEPEELIGQSIAETLSKEAFIKVKQYFENEVAFEKGLKKDSKRDRVLELPLKRKDGSLVWTEIRNSFIIDNTGSPVGILGITRDITSRRKAEGELRESEEKYRTVVENASQGVFIIQDGHIVFANQTVVKILGYSREELEKDHFIELVHEEDRETVIQNHTKRLEGKNLPVYHSRIKNKIGHYVTIEVNATTYTYNGKPATLNFANDITEKLKYETELKENEARYRSFFSNSIEAVSIFSTETRKFIDVNDAFCKMYGYTKEEAMLLSISDVSAEADVSEKAVKQAEKSGNVNIPVRYHKKKDGTIMVVSISAGPFIWKGQKVMYAILRDITEEKKIKQALAENEKRLNLAIETSNIGFYDWDIISGNIYYDENWMAALGYEHYELEHSLETWQGLVHPDDKGRVLNKLDLLLEGKVTYIEVEQRLLKKDGTWLWILERAKVIVRDDDWKPTRIMGTHLDINRRKLDQEEISKNQRYLNNIMDNSPAYIAYVDAENLTYQFVNNKFLKTYGFSKEEFKKKNAQDILGESNYQFALPYINQARQGTASSYENSIITEAEGKKWINGNFIPDFDLSGKVVGIFVFTYDLTELKNAKEDLELQKALLENILSTIPNQVFWKDRDLNYLGCNKAFAKVVGLDNPKEIVNMTDFDFARDSTHAESYRSFDKNIIETEKGIIDLHEKFHDINGVEGYVLTSKVPIRNEKEEVLGVLGICTDITELKNNEEKIKEQNEALAELNATKDKFFSIISHDLRSPFNSMLGFSELLVSNYKDFNDQQKLEYFNYIHDSIRHSYNLLDNLLLWALSQKGGIEFIPERVNLNTISHELINLLNQASQKKSIDLLIEIPEDIFVEADENMLSTIIRNLIANAIKFTPKGGEIVLKAVLTTNERGQRYAEITVKDNGLGISKEIQSKLFNISENTSTIGTEDETGTGLGLILCQEFVFYHKGRIWINSEVGKGSEFKFTIPIVKEE